MAFQIRWARRSVTDFEGILDHLKRASEEAAARLGESILTHIEVLRTFPHIGPTFSRDRSRRIREILCGGYRIFYLILDDEETVQILAIRHVSRRNPSPAQLIERPD